MKRIVCIAALLSLLLALFVPSYAVAAARPERGDANADGEISMKDVLTTRKYVADQESNVDFDAADGNGDEEITMKDVLLLRKYLAGMSVTFTAYKTDDYTPFALKTLAQEQVTLSFYDEAASTYAVTWHTTRKNYGPVAQVVKMPESGEPDFTNATVFEATTEEFTDYATLYNGETNEFKIVSKIGYKQQTDYTHRAVLTGLDYNTTYAYRVGDGKKKFWSDTFTFTTRPETVGDFSFVWLSDSQVTDTRDQTASHFLNDALTSAATVDPNFSFILHGGDVVQTSRYTHQWQQMINGNSEFVTKYPFMLVNGNHESINDTAGTYEIYKHMTFDLPEPNSKKSNGTYYSFDYGDAHFVVLNDLADNNRSSNVDNEQKAWVAEDLAKSTKKWKIVMMHVPVISSKNANLNQLNPIFAANGVDLVLQGDEHVYMRSHPFTYADNRNVMVTDAEKRTVNDVEYYVNPGGVVYTEAATAGNSQANINVTSVKPQNLVTYGQGQPSSFANISITGNMLTMKTSYYTASGIKTYTRGEWGIIKE